MDKINRKMLETAKLIARSANDSREAEIMIWSAETAAGWEYYEAEEVTRLVEGMRKGEPVEFDNGWYAPRQAYGCPPEYMRVASTRDIQFAEMQVFYACSEYAQRLKILPDFAKNEIALHVERHAVNDRMRRGERIAS